MVKDDTFFNKGLSYRAEQNLLLRMNLVNPANEGNKVNPTDFDNALWAARAKHVEGAEELMRLYQSLADDFEDTLLMSKLDAYVCDYPVADKLYRSIIG